MEIQKSFARRARLLAGAVVITVLAGTASAGNSSVIAPGFDLWATPPGSTEVLLDLDGPQGPMEPVPVPLQGNPILGASLGENLYDTDTIVQRLDGLPAGQTEGEVPIELVALSLQSIEPINIQGHMWDVNVISGSLLGLPPSETGRLQIGNSEPHGGNFSSQLPVNALINLRRVDNPAIVLGLPFQDVLNGEGVWSHIPGPMYPHAFPFPSGGFHPGVRIDPDTRHPRKVLTQEQSLLARHGVVPAMKVEKWSQLPHHRVGENIASDIDWRVLMDNPTEPIQPNWIVADDFRSDGRPIVDVIWWGSYFKPEDQPRQNPQTGEWRAVAEDGYVVSFFSDAVTPDGRRRPGELLGTYIAPPEVIKISPTAMVGWDEHRVWEYQLDLKDTHLEHASPLADPDAFLEIAGEVYWIAINAEVGHRIENIDGRWEFVDTGKPRRDEHFWGWHTSPDKFGADPQMGHLFMPGQEWIYRDWEDAEQFHNILPGDANNDLLVSGLDLIEVQRNFGKTEPPPPTGLLPGDANDDGKVSGLDLIEVQRNFGRRIFPNDMAFSLIVPPLGQDIIGGAPEPGTVTLLAGVALLLAGRRR